MYWFFILRKGNLSFWQLAAKYFDEAYLSNVSAYGTN